MEVREEGRTISGLTGASETTYSHTHTHTDTQSRWSLTAVFWKKVHIFLAKLIKLDKMEMLLALASLNTKCCFSQYIS